MRRVNESVRQVLADPRYKWRAEKIAEWSRQHDGAACAADELERFVTLS